MRDHCSDFGRGPRKIWTQPDGTSTFDHTLRGMMRKQKKKGEPNSPPAETKWILSMKWLEPKWRRSSSNVALLRGANVAPVNSCRALETCPCCTLFWAAIASRTNCAELAALDALHKLCGSTQTKNLSRRDRICGPTHSCPQNLCPGVCAGATLGSTQTISTRVFQIPHTRPGSTRQPETLQTCTFQGTRASKHHQNSTRRPPERHRNSETVAGKGRKSAKCWALPPFGAPPSGPPPFRGPTRSGPWLESKKNK